MGRAQDAAVFDVERSYGAVPGVGDIEHRLVPPDDGRGGLAARGQVLLHVVVERVQNRQAGALVIQNKDFPSVGFEQ